ncbi:MAG: chemotaxis protein CheB [Myxococcota bacterium]
MSAPDDTSQPPSSESKPINHTKAGPDETAAQAGEAMPANFPVVGVGASAGGLEALKQLTAAIPAETQFAYVLVTHQQAGQVTILPELLSKHSSLRFVTIEDGMRLEPGVVYVAPAFDITLEDEVLRLSSDSERSQHHSIDAFFTSLAALKERAVAVVLSGTGSDGTRGVADVSAAGGLVVVQDPGTARYADMPASAARTSFVDAIAAPGEIPARIQSLFASRRPLESRAPSEDVTGALYRVLHFLRTRTGQDFTAYKKSTLWRRIERRMNVQGVTSPQQYVRALEERPEEIEVLFRELLISVTSFFRDPETFVVLCNQLRSTFESWEEERPFRAWVPACATGEEAYSLAIAIREILTDLDRRVSVQIFATDLDQPAIDVARAGRYPLSIDAHVTPERLDRFFVKTDTGYRISKEIRESIVFAPQNVIKDPPFTKLDLLSCRNLLIYLEPELQRRVIGLFSYALRPDGLLLLGSSESIASFDDAFVAIDKKCKLFRRRDTRPETPAEFPEVPTGQGLPRAGRPRLDVARGGPTALSSIAERVVLTNLAPPSVLINERGDIAYFHGRTGKFLEPAAGEPVANIFGMLREGLRLDVSSALRQALTRSEPVVRPGLRVKSNGSFIRVKLSVRRIDEPELVRGMFLVSFEQEPELDLDAEGGAEGDQVRQNARINELELELQHTRDNLQATIEELETSNEELKSTNEELQSTNEELQSANEELETSREEMQSLNEELQTVNSELEERNRALSQANDDMQNLLNSTDVATVFLDDRLAIKRFTTQARKVFSLIDTDIGRPISDLSANLRYEELVNDAREVLRSLVFQEREILTKEGAWRMMRIMPYRTAENVIDGLVMTFIDIDRIKREQQAAEAARRFAESLVEALPAGVAVLDSELRVVTANQALYDIFRTNAKRTLGEPFQSLGDGFLDVPDLTESMSHVLDGSIELKRFNLPPTPQRFGGRHLRVSAHRMVSQPRMPTMVLLMIEDRGASDKG